MTREHDASTQVKVSIWLHPSDGFVPVLVWSWCVRAVPGVTGFGLPNRRKRVFVLASLHGDARDVLLSQVMHEHITVWLVQYEVSACLSACPDVASCQSSSTSISIGASHHIVAADAQSNMTALAWLNPSHQLHSRCVSGHFTSQSCHGMGQEIVSCKFNIVASLVIMKGG